jgi:hypothetical protein
MIEMTPRVTCVGNDHKGFIGMDVLNPLQPGAGDYGDRMGWAWHYVEYSDDEALATAEVEARAAKRGLWAGNSPKESERLDLEALQPLLGVFRRFLSVGC